MHNQRSHDVWGSAHYNVHKLRGQCKGASCNNNYSKYNIPQFVWCSQTGPCVLIRWPRYIYFPMDECTQPIRSILIIRPRFGAIHLYTEKQDKTQKVWLMFLCPKNILHRFNLPSWHFWKTIIIGNQISSFVEKHATHLKRFSFQIV